MKIEKKSLDITRLVQIQEVLHLLIKKSIKNKKESINECKRKIKKN